MFTGLEAQNRAQEFKVSIDIKSGTTQADIAEALRVIAERIDIEVVPTAGLLGFVGVGGENKNGYWAFRNGVRD